MPRVEIDAQFSPPVIKTSKLGVLSDYMQLTVYSYDNDTILKYSNPSSERMLLFHKQN